MIIFSGFVFFAPNVLGHSDNYIQANPMVTPAHIVPEWYLLPFYAILRAVPDKLGGVILMFGAILILFVLPWLDTSKVRSSVFRPIYRQFYWIFVIDVLMLGYLGAQPAEGIYLILSRVGTVYYFLHFILVLPVVGIVETVEELSAKGCKKTIGCNIGGTVKLEGLELVFTQAFHSMGSNPSGVIVFYNNKTIYHAGDTGVFGDMQLIGQMYPLDLAFLPVGGHFTMGLKEAQKAIQLLNAKKIVPIHYNTFDLIKQDIDESFAKESNSELLILEPGQEITL